MSIETFLRSEAGVAVMWVAGSLVLASLIAPWAYQGGKALAAMAEEKELPGLLEWLGAACGKSKFGRFYSRSLVFSAFILLPFLFSKIRRMRASSPLTSPALVPIGGCRGLVQTATGWLIGMGLLGGFAVILYLLGAYALDPHPPGFGKLLKLALIPSIAAPLVEEIVFRGLVLGLWLRSARPLAACVGTSLFFAFLHFLEPPAGFAIADPGAPLAGFELLGSILFHFADPKFFIMDFATLFAVGMILAWARLRTGALWFPIGLHAGWILAFKLCNLFFQDVRDHPLRPWGVGENVRSGLLPMIMLGLTAVLCHHVMRRFEVQRNA